MRDQVETGIVYFGSPIEIATLHLLVQGVVDPKVDVPPPVLLVFHRGGDIGDGTLVHLSHLAVADGGVASSSGLILFLHFCILEPGIVIGGIRGDSLLVLRALTRDDDVFDARLVPPLLLEGDVCLVLFVPLLLFPLRNFLLLLLLLPRSEFLRFLPKVK